MFRFLSTLTLIFTFFFQFSLCAFADDFWTTEISVSEFKNQKSSKENYSLFNIEDEALAPFKGKNLSKPVYTPVFVEDNTIKALFDGHDLAKPQFTQVSLTDEAQESLKGQNSTKTVYKLQLFEDETVFQLKTAKIPEKKKYSLVLIDENKFPVDVFVASKIKIATNNYRVGNFKDFKSQINVNDAVDFIVTKDVYKEGKLFIKKNTDVSATISNIVPSSMAGAPAELIVDNFITKDVDGNIVELTGNINRRGLTLSPIIYAVAYCGLPFTFGASSLLILLPGGQAVIKPKHKYKLTGE